MPVQDVQSGDEELMSVLLLVARQVARVRPHQVQQLVRDVWGPVPRVELLGEKRASPCGTAIPWGPSCPLRRQLCGPHQQTLTQFQLQGLAQPPLATAGTWGMNQRNGAKPVSLN